MYLSLFDESPRGVEPNVNSRLYNGTAPSSTAAFSRAWLSTQNDFSVAKQTKEKVKLLDFNQLKLERYKR
jgi:hypothetical protein